MPNCMSWPDEVRRGRGVNITPALFIRTSRRVSCLQGEESMSMRRGVLLDEETTHERKVSTAALIDARSERSSASTGISASVFPVVAFRSSTAA